jgi:hypothetical protein
MATKSHSKQLGDDHYFSGYLHCQVASALWGHSPIGLSICFRGMENTESRPRYMAKILRLIRRGMFPSSTASFKKPSSCEISLPASCIFMSREKLCLRTFRANQPSGDLRRTDPSVKTHRELRH